MTIGDCVSRIHFFWIHFFGRDVCIVDGFVEHPVSIPS